MQLKYDKYPAYKDSGEYWIGQIPENWGLKRLKHIFAEKKIKHNPALNCGSISFGKIVFKDDDKIPLSTKASYQEVLDGEFLINPLNLNYDLISLRIALSDKNVVVSSGYIVINNKEKIDKDYYKWLLHRYDVAYMKLLGSGVRQTISFNHIANSFLPKPPLQEQSTIAQHLDQKTKKIDQAIAQKELMIALLKERKQIMIQELVTGKIVWDKETESWIKPKLTKDSGVEWIGEIPLGWIKTPLRHILKKIEQGNSPSPTNGNSSSFVIKLSAIKKGEFYINELKPVQEKDFDARYQLKKGDFLMTRGNTPELVADTCIIRADIEDMVMYSDLVFKLIFDINKIDKNFILNCMQSSYLRRQIVMSARGSNTTMIKVSQDQFKSWVFFIPPLKEQTKIASKIQVQSTKIDQAITLQQKQIGRLKEYKMVFIDSLVTGKVKI